jgi:hypothetical protein
MGVKETRNVWISKIVSALGDESDDVKRNGVGVVWRIGEKAWTTEVVSELLVIIKGRHVNPWDEAAEIVKNILSSSLMNTQLGPRIPSDLCLCIDGFYCFEKVSEDQLIDCIFTAENPDFTVFSQFAFWKQVGVTVTEDEVVLYGENEPLKQRIVSLQRRYELIKAFSDQAKRLHLYFDMPSEAQNKSENFPGSCNIL